jgi:hypothetical protein
MVCSMLGNIYRDIKKKPEPYSPDDFMPFKREKKLKRQTWQEIKDRIMGHVAEHNKGVKGR